MTTRARLLKAFFLGAILCVGLAPAIIAPHGAYAQGITTGGLNGVVIDPTGAVLPDVSIAIVNDATGARFEQSSRGDGGFSIMALPIGRYTLTFSRAGFADAVLKNVQVDVGARSIGDISLKPSAQQTTVEVSAASPLVETTQSQVSETFSPEQLADLPLGNGFDAVTLLEPGVTQTHENNFSNNNGATFSVNGQRGRSNNFEIDGQSNNDNSVAGPQVFFSNQDAIAGVVVITNEFSAQYGRNMGGVVNYVTKGGTNQVHGTVFEMYEGNWGQAFTQGAKNPLLGYCAPGQSPTTGCLQPTLARFVDNRFGGTVGFPIIKDKLWAFGSVYFDRNHQGEGTYTSGNTAVFPTPDALTKLQADLPGNGGVASLVNSGPYSIKTGNPHPGALYKTRVFKVGTTTVSVDTAPVIRKATSVFNDQELMGRVDWQPTSKDHVFLRYFYQDDPYLNGGGSVTAGAWYNVPGTAHTIGADITHTFSPSWVNQLRYSFQQTKVLFQGGAQPECTVNTPSKCNSSMGLGSGYLGYGYGSTFPQGRTVKVTQIQDNASWNHGRHAVSFGGEWSYQNSPNPFLPNFNGTFSASSLQSFLNGTGTVNLADGNYTIHFTEPDAAAYAQDDWKVTSHLTLNLGMRWEFFGQAVNILHDETVKREADPAKAFWDTSLPLNMRTFQGVPNHYKNFQPRIGFAYSPGSIQRMAIRGGFAINYDPQFYNMFLNSATAAPVVNLGTITSLSPVPCSLDAPCLPSTGTKGADFRALNLPKIPRGVDPNIRNQTTVAPDFGNPYAETYSVGVAWGPNDHLVFEARYSGNNTTKLFQSLNANPLMLNTALAYPDVISPDKFCTTAGAIGKGRTDCNRKRVRERANTAFSNYNGLQLSARTRDFHHLNATFGYTFSKTIDNASEVYGTFTGGSTSAFAQNPFNTKNAERAVSGGSIPHVASASFVYEFPMFHDQKGLVGKLLGGYQVNGIWTYDVGMNVTPYQLGYGAYGYVGMSDYCDTDFASAFNSAVSTCRPVSSNKNAPGNTSGIYINADSAANLGIASGYYDLGSIIDYQNGATDANLNPIMPVAKTKDQVRWLYNNTDLADLMGNPFPGNSRGSLRGNGWNNINANIFKNTTFHEKYTLQLQFMAYNALNKRLLGTPDPEIDDTLYGSETFWNNAYNSGTNARQVQLGARIIF